MLRTAADLVRTLDEGTYELADVYDAALRAGLDDQPGARRDAGDGQPVWKRRVRTALYAAQRQGRVRCRREGRQAVWLVDGTPDLPRRALLVWLPREPGQAEMVLGKAVDILGQVEEPIDLIVADPPWGLGRGEADSAYQRTYRRNHDLVMPGYVEVEPEQYADFTAEWVTAAAGAIRPGGYLAIVTGPERSADAQIAARNAGLTYVNSITVPTTFGAYCTRRLVHQHWRITLVTNGKLDSARRMFRPAVNTQVGRNGGVYATDVWPTIPKEQRRDLLRYDNTLPVPLVDGIIQCTTKRGDLVADPFQGGGTTLVACLHSGRRYYGGDANPHSLRYTMGLVVDEVLPAIQAAADTEADRLIQLMLDIPLEVQP